MIDRYYPLEQSDASTSNQGVKEVATLGGGCFWCLEAVYSIMQGVEQVESGYTGGTVVNPSYEQVCKGSTGHAEVVQVIYDPSIVNYKDILTVFFSTHDPTTLNRQGNDVGTQYRSAIFYHNEVQKQAAENMIEELERQDIWDKPIVTEVAPLTKFYPAEAYHQEYFKQNPNQAYCQFVVAPKVAKFRQQFADKLKS